MWAFTNIHIIESDNWSLIWIEADLVEKNYSIFLRRK
jgi:hypothetical protein